MQEFSIHSANIALEGYSIIICLVLMIYYISHMDIYRRQKRWIVALLVTNVCMMLGDLTDWLYNGVPGTVEGILLQAGLCCFYACTGIILFNLVGYLICLTDSGTVGSCRIGRLATAVMALQVACSVLSLWNGMYFRVTEDNVYMRGPCFALAQLFPAVLYVFCILLIWNGRRKLTVRSAVFLIICILLPAIGQLLQVLFYGGAYVNAAATIALIILNINVQSEQELAVRKTEKELTDLQVDIMLSQIRPHFLYNALTAIRQLCDTDPRQAKESILDFSRFLRANMNSLTTNQPIPFNQELEHARSYLNLEQQRFGRRLRVIYDINTRDFKVPTLTLQPMVENAVRHGIRRKEEGGTVKIYTEEWKNGYVIVVSDDGVGMEMAATFWEDSTHIGISNVRRRIQKQCGGSMMIKSSAGGTVVTMWFPKPDRAEKDSRTMDPGGGGKEHQMKEIQVEARLENLDEVMDFVREQLEDCSCSPKQTMQIEIAVEEIYVNIAHYAYHPETGYAVVRCWVDREPVQIIIQFLDEGWPYNPLERPDPDVTAGAKEREIGGLGIYMAKKSMDGIEYSYEEGKNILTITKFL